MIKFFTEMPVVMRHNMLTGAAISAGIVGLICIFGSASLFQMVGSLVFAILIGGGIGAAIE
jgi:hypothetical protein